MTGQEDAGRADGVLEILDAMATHAIELRALVVTLAPDRAGPLRTLCDGLLAEIARCIVRELPPRAATPDDA